MSAGKTRLARGYFWDADLAVDRIREFAVREGRPPNTFDFHEPDSGLPSRSTARRLFGTIGDALVESGFPRPAKSEVWQR